MFVERSLEGYLLHKDSSRLSDGLHAELDIFVTLLEKWAIFKVLCRKKLTGRGELKTLSLKCDFFKKYPTENMKKIIKI